MTGTKIREWRERQGQTRAWVGKQCGVSARTVEAWEQGHRHPGGSALLLLQQLVSASEKKEDKDAER
jgi:DNA-binding transcriptional regulator YiaG